MKFYLTYILKYLIWLIKGRKKVDYLGFHCQLCGKWQQESFSVPAIQSLGEYWDTWNICDKCRTKYEWRPTNQQSRCCD